MADETKKLTGAAAASAAAKAAKVEESPGNPEVVQGTEGASTETAGMPSTVKKAAKAVKPQRSAKGSQVAAKATTKKIEPQVKKMTSESFEEIAARYKKMYPSCGKFHITDDRQVFLEGSESAARLHQRSLAGGGVHTIEIE